MRFIQWLFEEVSPPKKWKARKRTMTKGGTVAEIAGVFVWMMVGIFIVF